MFYVYRNDPKKREIARDLIRAALEERSSVVSTEVSEGFQSGQRLGVIEIVDPFTES